MKIVVIGATGRLGSRVLSTALDAGHHVTALARNPSAVATDGVERLSVVPGDVRDLASLEAALAGQDAAISCLGTRDRKQKSLRTEGIRNIIAAAQAGGVRRLVVFSAFGVGDSRGQLNRTTFMFGRIILPLFLRAQFEDMARMERLVRESDLEWVIVRPSALTDKPATGDVKIFAGSGKAGSAIPLGDVAAFMVECVTGDAHVGTAPVIYA